MFKRILPLAFRNIPYLAKAAAFTLSFMCLKYQTNILKTTSCFNFPKLSGNNIFTEVLPKVIRVEHNGQIVGYAYALTENLMVTINHDLLDKKQKMQEFQFFIGGQKIKTKAKCVGSYEQFTFFEVKDALLQALPSKHADLFTPVHVIYNKNFLTVKDGYYVGNDSGYGVLDARGEIGSLILNQSGVVGIVTHIGRDQDQGFIRFVFWNDLKNLANRVKNNKNGGGIYLGISAVASPQYQGVSVVRVNQTSPLISFIKMGDIITKINDNVVKNPQDLTRLIMFSDHKVTFEIEGSDKTKKLITVQF